MEIDLNELEQGQPHWLSQEAVKRRSDKKLRESAARKIARLVREVAKSTGNAVAEHLPGQHNQKDHGREGGGSDGADGGDKPRGSAAFISPNIDEGLQVSDAIKRIRGQRHLQMQKSFQEVDAAVGIEVASEAAIGAWADGAENSIVCRFPAGTDFETVRAAAAMKGLIGEQKAVLVFQPAEEGPQRLYEIELDSGDVQSTHDDLLAAGIEFHTLVPHADGKLSVFVYAQDDSLLGAVNTFMEQHDGRVDVTHGAGEFIGSWTSREEGTAEYERVLGAYEGRGEAEGKVVQRWRAVRDHWRSHAAQYQAAEAAARQRAIAAARNAVAKQVVRLAVHERAAKLKE